MVSGIQHLFLPSIAEAGLLDKQQPHYRECRRRAVDIPADIRLCLSDGTAFDRGSARIANISASGAFLADVRLNRGRLPIGPSVLHVTMRGEAYDGVTMACRPVRVAAGNSSLGLGVRLEHILISLDSDSDSDSDGKRRPSTRTRKKA